MKNQINLVNMRIAKEGEARSNAETSLRKNNERFSTDTQKFSYSLRNCSKENEELATKLEQTDAALHGTTNEKRDLEAQLEQRAAELEDLRKRHGIENEEKNRRISMLHQELRELQERVNEQGVRGNMLEAKNKDLGINYDRSNAEGGENVARLRSENERLQNENKDLISRTHKLGKDVEASRDH